MVKAYITHVPVPPGSPADALLITLPCRFTDPLPFRSKKQQGQEHQGSCPRGVYVPIWETARGQLNKCIDRTFSISHALSTYRTPWCVAESLRSRVVLGRLSWSVFKNGGHEETGIKIWGAEFFDYWGLN